jgi:hypothetical protein
MFWGKLKFVINVLVYLHTHGPKNSAGRNFRLLLHIKRGFV